MGLKGDLVEAWMWVPGVQWLKRLAWMLEVMALIPSRAVKKSAHTAEEG